MATEILRLNETNANRLQDIGPDVFDNAIDPVQLHSFLADPRHVMFIAIDGCTVVGMGSGVEFFHPDKKPQLFINEIGTASTHRRQGIARRLVEALIAEAVRRDCDYAWLGTETDNLPAQACFASVPEVEQPQSFLLYEWDLED